LEEEQDGTLAWLYEENKREIITSKKEWKECAEDQTHNRK
jgi:hypothetical protein